MDVQLKILVDLQAVDTRRAGLEALLAKIPEELRVIRAGVEESTANAEKLRQTIETARKDIRTKEKELEFQASQRSKCEAKLYEVKTNKEYSAVLAEIEQFKTQQGKIEEEILALMESQERLSREHQEAAAKLKVREQEARGEEEVVNRRQVELQAQHDSVLRERLELTKQLPADLLASYEKLLRHLHGLALAPVSSTGKCGGRYVTLPPQRLQELRQQSRLLTCESCGRYIYWLATY